MASEQRYKDRDVEREGRMERGETNRERKRWRVIRERQASRGT